MKFGDLVNSHHWLSVSATLQALYPDKEEDINEIGEVYSKLKLMALSDVAIDIVLEQHYDDETAEPSCVSVSGINLEPNPEDVTIGLAIEFTPWSEWMGMGICKQTVKEFTELEILAHCLVEMTYAGFDEAEIKAELEKIIGIQKEYQKAKKNKHR